MSAFAVDFHELSVQILLFLLQVAVEIALRLHVVMQGLSRLGCLVVLPFKVLQLDNKGVDVLLESFYLVNVALFALLHLDQLDAEAGLLAFKLLLLLEVEARLGAHLLDALLQTLILLSQLPIVVQDVLLL